MPHIDPGLYEFATTRQREFLDAIESHGGARAAERALGVANDVVGRAYRTVKANAAAKGYAPGQGFDNRVPEGFHVRSASLNFNRDNQLTQKWLKIDVDKEQRDQAILDAIDERIARIAPFAPIPMPVSFGPEKHLTQVSIFDGHIGAHAWAPETGGGNWDLKIARETMMTGVSWLFDNAPPAQDALIIIGGDFTEVDGFKPLTPGHGHLLDADGRYPKIFEVAESVIEHAVVTALRNRRHVTLTIRPGNHDPVTSFALRRVFMRAFRDNPRVTIDASLREYWAMLFGKTMIACHHGDKAALNQLPGIFAADFARMWGEATYRVCHSGHWHHEKTLVQTGIEKTGMMMYQHPTVEQRNAWAAGKGLIAARQLVAHTYHAGGGIVATTNFNPDIVMGLAA